MSKKSDIRDTRKGVALGAMLGWLMRIASHLIRLRVEARWQPPPGSPVIFALWHNRFFVAPPTYIPAFGRGRKCAILTSASKDGAVVARAMAVFDFGAVRGSSSRRGVAALVALTRAVRQGWDVSITPDGPRGPRYELHPGMIKLAETTGAPIIPVHVTFASAWRLKTWDRFVIPKPFSRVRVVYDHPIYIKRTDTPEAFEAQRKEIESVLLAGVDDL